MIFVNSLVQHSRVAREQLEGVHARRRGFEAHELSFGPALRAEGFHVNVGLIPQDVYQDFDRVTVERMRHDDGDVFLNDLLPNSRSVNIGKIVHKYRRASDAGIIKTSLSGQTGVKMDQVDYNYDGALIPIHDGGFSRSWREWNAQSSEGFDSLIDDQRETVASLRAHMADAFLDGHTDEDGNVIVVDGVSWAGMRADSRVAQVNIGASGINFDFTSTAATGAQIKAAFIQLRDVLFIDNKCAQDANYYVSLEVASNWERAYSEAFQARTILEELAKLMGVASIKACSKLSGNEIMAFVNSPEKVRPVVGMGVNTVPMPRPVYNSNYEFAVWAAVGFQVKTDYSGNTCAMFAQDLG